MVCRSISSKKQGLMGILNPFDTMEIMEPFQNPTGPHIRSLKEHYRQYYKKSQHKPKCIFLYQTILDIIYINLYHRISTGLISLASPIWGETSETKLILKQLRTLLCSGFFTVHQMVFTSTLTVKSWFSNMS